MMVIMKDAVVLLMLLFVNDIISEIVKVDMAKVQRMMKMILTMF